MQNRGGDEKMAIGTCKVCGKNYETTDEDANTPLWCAKPKDRICTGCYQEQQKKPVKYRYIGDPARIILCDAIHHLMIL